MAIELHDSTNADADTRLIAAAPELLDVLTLALPYVRTAGLDGSYTPGEVVTMVRRMTYAINKAS
jgi:hypothetical protein